MFSTKPAKATEANQNRNVQTKHSKISIGKSMVPNFNSKSMVQKRRIGCVNGYERNLKSREWKAYLSPLYRIPKTVMTQSGS